MKIRQIWVAIKEYLSRLFKHSSQKNTLFDTVRLDLWGLHIKISRELPADIPHELTVVVPRSELRKNCNTTVDKSCGAEILLNSITIAHSPRFEGTK